MMTETPDVSTTNENCDATSFYLGLMKERTPEKASLLQSVVDQFGIHFETEPNDERCRFSSQSQTGKITVGLKGMARLMGHAFAYACAHYGLLCRLQSLLKDVKSEQVNETAETRSASQLLTWAVAGDIRSKVSEYDRSFIPECLPEDLVELVEGCLPTKQQEIAAEIFANAIVWILYHEVSHIQMGHVSCEGIESLEQERQADRMAAEWMLDSKNIQPVDLCKRQWGIATALGWLTATTVFLGPGSMKTHPAAYDRLYQTLDYQISDEHEDVWLFVQVVLLLHILHAGLQFSEEWIGPPFKENANHLIDVIAAVGRN